MQEDRTLWELKTGESGQLLPIRDMSGLGRRLRDMGFSAGARVTCVGRSPLGDPGAYLVQGAVVAVRKCDAEKLRVIPETASSLGGEPADRPEPEPAGSAPGFSPELVLSGNPNVGKSTVFNQLTGMHQHVGNWTGKTVAAAEGILSYGGRRFRLVDVPGCYSLMSHSADEEAARDRICFGAPDAVVVVCDAVCLERSLQLALQVLEVTPNVVICVNLMDEARKKGIHIDLAELSARLGAPVVGCEARQKKGIRELVRESVRTAGQQKSGGGDEPAKARIAYPDYLTGAAEMLACALKNEILKTARGQNAPLSASDGSAHERGGLPPVGWMALRLLDGPDSFRIKLEEELGGVSLALPVARARMQLCEKGISREQTEEDSAAALAECARRICAGVVHTEQERCDLRDRRWDRLFTSRLTGFPIMAALLLLIFYLTIEGANVPSDLLWSFFSAAERTAFRLALGAGLPALLCEAVFHGVFRVLAFVISVMLPPMMIFFPLFTLLEDFGYLPRVAFNLDRCFQGCRACGKQALTMCMGCGCNAVGVTGCRIIESRRERLIAMLTNSLIPCNGRFPILIAILSLFFAGSGAYAGAVSALGLVLLLILSVGMTFLLSRILSGTLLRGEPSAFALELPPYRRPQVGRVIVRSILDRTLFVLGRAAAVAAPAGLVIWLLANLTFGGATLLSHLTRLLDPAGRVLGMDGVILLAFLLGFPASEIVIPIMLMAYTSGNTLTQIADLSAFKNLLLARGWTWETALCTMLFTLMHWPCSTTVLTIRRESGSWKWAILSILLPLAAGCGVCMLVHLAAVVTG